MSLILPPIDVLWQTASHVEADATIESDHEALSSCAAGEMSTMIQSAATQDLHAIDELCEFCVASLRVL